MKKVFSILAVAILSIALFSSCADEKTFTKRDGTTFIAEPYGWMNTSKKIPGVEYDVCPGNVVWSIISSETVIVPVLLTGLSLWEPVKYVEPVTEPINNENNN